MSKILKSVFSNAGLSALLAFCVILIYSITKMVFYAKAIIGLYDLIMLAISALIMIIAMVYQLFQRKWLIASGNLVLGIIILALGVVVFLMTGIYHSSRESWIWHLTRAILPNGLGSIILQTRESHSNAVLEPERMQEWKVRIDTNGHSPYTIQIGDTMMYTDKLEIFLIHSGNECAIRLDVDNKSFYYNTTLRHTVDKIHKDGKKLGIFYMGEFIYEGTEHAKAKLSDISKPILNRR